MSANEQTLAVFTTRVRQMILRYDEVLRENAHLNETIANMRVDIKTMQEKLKQAQNDYDSLKMAKMIDISDTDMDGAKKRLSKLIRDVNKCIMLLSDK